MDADFSAQSLAVNVSLACFPGMRHEWAASAAVSGVQRGLLVEQMFGRLQVDHVQFVPQSSGLLTQEVACLVATKFPDTRFRLHANVRLLKQYRVADLSNLPEQLDWFSLAAQVSQALHAPAYSAHAGRRANASLAQMLDNARRATDLFGCPVAVEGLYPSRGDDLLVSTWPEYQALLESGLPFALDLSHLNILARHTGRQELALVQEMLASEQCVEVHVSDNDGRGDTHQVCARPAWWMPLLAGINPAAVVFTEGNHRRAVHGGQP